MPHTRFLPLGSLGSIGGDRHQTGHQYKHILRDYDKDHKEKRTACYYNDGVVVYKMFSCLLFHPYRDSLIVVGQILLSPFCREGDPES